LLFVQAVLWAIVSVGLVVLAIDLLRRPGPNCGYTCTGGDGMEASFGALTILGCLAFAAFAAGLALLSGLLAIRLRPRHVDAAVTAVGLELLQFVLFTAAAWKGGVLLVACGPCAVFSLAVVSCLLNPPAWRFVVAR
jgi:hypothetical protein